MATPYSPERVAELLKQVCELLVAMWRVAEGFPLRSLHFCIAHVWISSTSADGPLNPAKHEYPHLIIT